MTEITGGALWRRATLLAQQGRFAEAERWVRESIGVDPDDPDILALLANLQYPQDDAEARALETIDRAIALAPRVPYFREQRRRFLGERAPEDR